MENSPDKGDWILEVADSFASLGQYDYAVKLYSTLEEIVGDKNVICLYCCISFLCDNVQKFLIYITQC